MALMDRVRTIFKRNQPAGDTTAAPGNAPSIVGSENVYEQLKADRERIAVIKTCREMYATDSRVEKAHRFYARDIVRAGFFVTTKNKEALQIANDLQKRLDLNQLLEDCVRLTARDGDSFYEVVVDDALNIAKLSRKPTLQMRRNSNTRDEFDNPSRAFWQSDKPWYSPEPPKDAVWYADWQMMHARWKYDGETRYGMPMFSSATGAFKKVVEGEMNVAVRRKIGGAQIRQHVVEGSEADVEKYKENNAAALGKLNAVVDFFSNKASSMTVIQGDGNIDRIGDVNHHVATMMSASDVPMELIVYGEGLNRDILGEKKEEYDETLFQGREWLTTELVAPLLERQWLLKGILPDNLDYEIKWRKAKPLTPADLRDLADALSRYKLLGVDDDVIKQLAALYLRDVDMDILKSGNFSVDQFAQNLKGLSI